ncbi:MAG: glycosyltransferase [Candidatus Paceibacterota bacterium]|nr:MAG: glycosyltransferase [Candidatus Paceibacterota bacterium]
MPHESSALIRILCIITQSDMGGAQRFISELVTHSDAQRFTFSVAAGPDGNHALRNALPERVAYRPISSLRRAIAPWHDLRCIRDIREHILAEKPDILFLNSSKAGILGAIAARSCRKALPHMRIVYRIGGWQFRDPIHPLLQTTYRTLERWSARWKDVIVVNSESDRDAGITHHIAPRRELIAIHNGIDPYPTTYTRAEARAHIAEAIQIPISDTTTLIGTIANAYPAKDLPTYIRAALHFNPQAHWIIVGDGPERPALEQLIRRLDLQSRVHIIGQRQDAKMLIPAFDVFVLASVKEGFPWALLEAMAAKVPSVATRVGGIPEIITDGEDGLLVEPQNPAALAQRIHTLVAEERLAHDIVIAAHQRIVTRFSLQSMIAAYERLFITLLREQSPAGSK